MKKLSGVLISWNEEAKIGAALQSLKEVCDEIVVVDSFSRDRTEEICRAFTDRFYQRKWEGYVKQKQAAVDLARNDWILSLDADEKLSPELSTEISCWKQEDSSEAVGFRIPRLTYFLGRFIYHTTWHPDYQIRLFRRSKRSWEGGRLHESFHPDGPVLKLKNPILHFTYASVSEYLVQLERFSTLAAADYHERGRQAGIARILFYPPLVFLKNYLVKKGFLDGIPGVAVSFLSAASTFFNYLKLWELQHGLIRQEEEWDRTTPTQHPKQGR